MLQDTLRARPAFIDTPLKGCRWHVGPEFAPDRPVLLEERTKWRLVEPEEAHLCGIVKRMLRAAHTLKIFVVEPIHIRMGVAWVSGSAIDVTTIHRPEVRDDVNVSFCDVRGDVRIENSRNKLGLH